MNRSKPILVNSSIGFYCYYGTRTSSILVITTNLTVLIMKIIDNIIIGTFYVILAFIIWYMLISPVFLLVIITIICSAVLTLICYTSLLFHLPKYLSKRIALCISSLFFCLILWRIWMHFGKFI